jgi:hypothetical protein
MTRTPNPAALAAMACAIAAPGGGVDVDDVSASPVPGDDAAAAEGGDGLRADGDVLGDDRVGVPGDVDDLVFCLALGSGQL